MRKNALKYPVDKVKGKSKKYNEYEEKSLMGANDLEGEI